MKTPKKPKKFHFECGCVYTEKQYKKLPKKNGTFYCKKHPYNKPIQVEIQCAMCGVIFFVRPKSQKRLCCNDCYKIQNNTASHRTKRNALQRCSFIFNCGCVKKYPEISHNFKNRRVTCPDHPKMTIKKITCKCVICKKRMSFRNVSEVKQTCTECAKKRKRKNDNKIRLKNEKVPIRKPECINYNHCLNKAAFNNEKISCEKCKHYQPISDFLKHEAFTTNHDFIFKEELTEKLKG